MCYNILYCIIWSNYMSVFSNYNNNCSSWLCKASAIIIIVFQRKNYYIFIFISIDHILVPQIQSVHYTEYIFILLLFRKVSKPKFLKYIILLLKFLRIPPGVGGACWISREFLKMFLCSLNRFVSTIKNIYFIVKRMGRLSKPCTIS